MQTSNTSKNKKPIIIEIVVAIVFFVGAYYLYKLFSEPAPIVETTTINEGLIGQNTILFFNAINKDQISFDNTDFMNGNIVKQLQDFSEDIVPEEYRGRLNPFEPYASTRSIH